MRSAAERRESTHLLEVGVSWPPETFLQWKLGELVARGLRITLASADVYDASFSIPGVRLLILPAAGESIASIVCGAAVGLLKLAIRSPRRLLALIRAFRDPAFFTRPPLSPRYRRSPWKALVADLAWLRIMQPLAALRPDLVHFEWESAAVRFAPLTAAWRCPIVMSCHGGLRVYGCSPAYAAMISGLPNAFDRAAAVQCVSRTERSEALRLGLEPSRAAVIPCGVDPQRFSPPTGRVRRETLRIISVGWLRWLKGHEYAVQTVRELLDSGIPARLDVYGGDPLPGVGELSERARILHAIEDLGVADDVVLHGYLPTDQLIARYRQADVLLHSSVSEGLPVVILEAMATELPVVASDAGGVREAVRDGVDGFLVPVRDPRAAAAALERLWREPDLASCMGRAGRQRVVREFSLERTLEQLEQLYLDAARAPLACTEDSQPASA